MTVEAIHFGEEGVPELWPVESAVAVASQGLEGDRHFHPQGVNSLVGKRFRVGEVECYGVELCEPCLHLESLTRPGIIKELVHRAGLNADILVGGTIRIGDDVVVSDTEGKSN